MEKGKRKQRNCIETQTKKNWQIGNSKKEGTGWNPINLQSNQLPITIMDYESDESEVWEDFFGKRCTYFCFITLYSAVVGQANKQQQQQPC